MAAQVFGLSAAGKRVQAARTALVLDQPFFGVLALQLALREDPTCATAWVDGKTLGYSPAFVAGLSDEELKGLICHEVLHCALGHPWRRGGRDHKRFNVAADYALNPLVLDAGMRLPEGALVDGQYSGHHAEWIYDRLPEGAPEGPEGDQGDDQGEGEPGEGGDQDGAPEGDQGDQPGDQDGDQDGDGDQPGDGDGDGQGGDQGEGDAEGEGQGGGGQGGDAADLDGDGNAAGGQGAPEAAGEVRDAPADADAPSEADWQEATKQAEKIAAAYGQLGAGMGRAISEARAPETDWRSALRRFVQETCAADYSWQRPNPRYLAGGLYLPALRAEACGPIVVAVDTSGSVDEVLLAQFGAELQAIAEDVQPERIEVIYCDAEVNRVQVFERGEVLTLEPCGGGGTDFGPVFAHVDADAEGYGAPAVLVYLTDLYGSFPTVAPDYPVLWAVTGRGGLDVDVPFGDKLAID